MENVNMVKSCGYFSRISVALVALLVLLGSMSLCIMPVSAAEAESNRVYVDDYRWIENGQLHMVLVEGAVMKFSYYDEGGSLVKKDYIYLWVDENTPLTASFFSENPDYCVTVKDGSNGWFSVYFDRKVTSSGIPSSDPGDEIDILDLGNYLTSATYSNVQLVAMPQGSYYGTITSVVGLPEPPPPPPSPLELLATFVVNLVVSIVSTITVVTSFIYSEPLALIPCLIGLSLLGITVLRGFIKTKR